MIMSFNLRYTRRMIEFNFTSDDTKLLNRDYTFLNKT